MYVSTVQVKISRIFPPDRRPDRTRKLTDGAGEVEGAVTGDAGADPGHLLLYPGLVLDAARHVGPRAVLLTLRHVVPAARAHHGARVAHVGLGAVAGEPGTRDELPRLPLGITLRKKSFFQFILLISPPCQLMSLTLNLCGYQFPLQHFKTTSYDN